MRMSDFFNFVGTNNQQSTPSSDGEGVQKLQDGSSWKYIRDGDVYENTVSGSRISPIQLDNLKISFERH